MIKAKLDVTKIDKAALFKGKKGIYLDIVLIETPNNRYGDSHMVVQDLGKDARDRGQKGPILGNAKTFDKGGQRRPVGGAGNLEHDPDPDPIDDDDVHW